MTGVAANTPAGAHDSVADPFLIAGSIRSKIQKMKSRRPTRATAETRTSDIVELRNIRDVKEGYRTFPTSRNCFPGFI